MIAVMIGTLRLLGACPFLLSVAEIAENPSIRLYLISNIAMRNAENYAVEILFLFL